MRAHEIVARLEAFGRRGPGTDAERRAANWLAAELEHPAREVRIEPFWCRPNWAAAHVWHVALAIAGSLVSVSNAGIGLALLVVALLSISADALFGVSLGRRLTSERASQNVIASTRTAHVGSSGRRDGAPPLRLIVTANYDAGRSGLVQRAPFRNAAASLRRTTGPYALGWLAWLSLGIAWLLVVAILRLNGHHSTAVGIAQFVPTALLVLGAAALLELATADYGPSANDNATGTALAMALVRALDASPPRHMEVELILQGAGEGGAIGLRQHLRRHRAELDRANMAVLGLAGCGAGDLRWWTSDGSLLPLRYSQRMRLLCAQIAEHGEAGPHRGRGSTPALPARLAGMPAITLGRLDSRGLTSRSHQPHDVAADVDEATLDATLEFALILVDALDTFLGQAPAAEQAHVPAQRNAPQAPVPTPAPTDPRPTAEAIRQGAEP